MTDPIELARHARNLLQDETLQLVFRQLRDDSTKLWQTSSPGNADLREEAYADIRALGRIEARLKSLADGPKVTAFNKGQRQPAS
jgi:hypothetical protein